MAEHSERRKHELDYTRGTGVVCQKGADFENESSVSNHETQCNGDSPSMEDIFFAVEEGSEINSAHFNADVERAQKTSFDAREVWLIEWKVLNNTHELLEKLCISYRGNH